LEGRTPLLAGVDGTLDAGHFVLAPSSFLTRGASWSLSISGRLIAVFFFGDFFSRMWLEKGWRARTLPLAVVLKRFLAPECVFILGIARASVWQTPGRYPRAPASGRRCRRRACELGLPLRDEDVRALQG